MYEEIIEPYIARLAATGRKETTTAVVRYRLISCFRTLEQGGRTTDPLKLTEEDYHWLKDRLIATRTRETTAKAMLKVLDKLVVFSGGDPVLRTADILWNRTLPDRAFITVEDAARMYEAADPPLRLVIVLGALMGLRREEIAGIRLGDIRQTDILIHGKGHGSAGLVTPQPMPAEVLGELEAYLPWRLKHARAGSPHLVVMLTADGKRPVKDTRRLDVIGRRVRELGASLGIRVTTHSLRRLYATTVYEVTGHDAAVTQALMRHASSITTFDCYIKPNARAKAEAVEKVGAALSLGSFYISGS